VKILCVSSPHAYTTRDCWQKVMKGLRLNGADVIPFDLLPRYNIYDNLIQFAEKEEFELPEAFKINLLACEPVFGAAHAYDVDAVMVTSPQYFPMTIIDMLRKDGFKTIAYFTECPYEDSLPAPMQASHFDYVFVNDRNSVGLFQSFARKGCWYLPHSYDPDVHNAVGDEERDDNVLFVGTGYANRRQFFQKIDWTGIKLDLYGMWWMPSRSKLRPFVRGDVQPNENVAEMYRHAGTTISIHRTQRWVDAGQVIDENEAFSAGPRTYEAAACGIYQVSDYRREIEEIFGESVRFYSTPRELEAELRRAVEDPAWRKNMARKQAEAIRPYTCQQRMATVMEAVA